MSYTAVVKDGKIVDTSASNISDSTKKTNSSGSLDKEAFLQLLVAQMQYQDPLEPMDNTEYVSQLATFSELEAMNNLNDSMSIARATELVGKNVLCRTTSSTTGESYMTQGTVDYVVIENGKAYLAIGEGLFSIDDLDTVLSDEYWKKYQENQTTPAVESVRDVLKKILAVPEKSEDVTEEHEKAIKEARESYNSLSEEDKALVSNDALYRLIKAEAALTKLLANKKQESGGGENTDAGNAEAGDEGPESTQTV